MTAQADSIRWIFLSLVAVSTAVASRGTRPGGGLSVELAEMNDLAWATSSASTKLFHGGLRYLEYFEVRLVREALIERETLLRAMPHISWPMRFVLPMHKDMRFENDTPTSQILSKLGHAVDERPSSQLADPSWASLCTTTSVAAKSCPAPAPWISKSDEAGANRFKAEVCQSRLSTPTVGSRTAALWC